MNHALSIVGKTAILTIPDKEIDEVVVNGKTMKERKAGKWIWNANGMDWGIGAWVCSECRSKPGTWWESDKKYNPLICSGGSFCGNCGTDMRQENDKKNKELALRILNGGEEE